MTTPAQQQDKVQNAQINAQALQPVTLTPNQGSVVPNVWQQNYVQDSIGDNPTITPPTESNIHKNMFIGSGMVGLMAALATGNPAAGIVAGMWGAVAIHDHGYDLRQRSKQVNKLQAEGYSFPAILDWYKTGSSKELDKERAQMEDERRADNRTINETNRFNAQQETERTNHKDQMEQERLNRNVSIAAQGQAQKNADRMYNLQLMKYAQDVGKTVASAPVESDGIHAQNVALIQGGGEPQTAPAVIAAMPPEQRAAAMNAYTEQVRINGLKDIATQLSNAKNLRMGLSTPNQLFGKVEDYYKKGLTAPHTQAGDFQANQSVLGIESPTAAPRANQVEATEKHMPDGISGWIADATSRNLGYGQSDAARENTNKVLTNSFMQQASGLANEAKNAVQSGGYDLNNPKVLAGVVAGLGGHISGDDLKELLNGDMTPEQWAKKEADKYSAEKTVDFGDVQDNKTNQQNTGAW